MSGQVRRHRRGDSWIWDGQQRYHEPQIVLHPVGVPSSRSRAREHRNWTTAAKPLLDMMTLHTHDRNAFCVLFERAND
jgi:hypothetical protein